MTNIKKLIFNASTCDKRKKIQYGTCIYRVTKICLQKKSNFSRKSNLSAEKIIHQQKRSFVIIFLIICYHIAKFTLFGTGPLFIFLTTYYQEILELLKPSRVQVGEGPRQSTMTIGSAQGKFSKIHQMSYWHGHSD